MNNSEDISQDNKSHEKRTFADDDFRAERFGNGDRPADGKTAQKQDFPNAEIFHNFDFQ